MNYVILIFLLCIFIMLNLIYIELKIMNSSILSPDKQIDNSADAGLRKMQKYILIAGILVGVIVFISIII